MQNTIIYLIGFPGVGKLTVGKAICEKTSAKLVDNHMANNPIFSIISPDGVTPIPVAAWDRVKRIRDIIFDTILHVSPKEFSFVLTNVLLDDEGDKALFNQVRQMAEMRGSRFVPVILECSYDELAKRVVSPGRAENHKETDLDLTLNRIKKERLLPFIHPNTLVLDTTFLQPEESANKIIAHILSL